MEEGPFQYISMDLITNLLISNKYNAILTIVDQGYSKAAKFLPCRKIIDGQGVAKLYFRHIFPLFGIPKRVTVYQIAIPDLHCTLQKQCAEPQESSRTLALHSTLVLIDNQNE